MTKQEFIQHLEDKGLVFGWWNGEFVSVPESPDCKCFTCQHGGMK